MPISSGSHPVDRETAEQAERFDAAALGLLGVHDHAGGGSVGELAGVARGHAAALDDGAEASESLRGGVGAVAFVAFERDALVVGGTRFAVDDQLVGRDRNDLVVEAAGGLRGSGAALALECKRILRVARDVVAFGHDLRGLDHAHVDLRLALDEPGIFDHVSIEVLVLHKADRLQPARDDGGGAVDNHARRRDRDRLQPRAAIPVDRDARGLDRQAGAEDDLTGDVHAGGALAERAAHDHVVDLGWVEARPLHGGGHGVGAKRGAGRRVEGAPIGLADRGARGRDDDRLGLVARCAAREVYGHVSARRRGRVLGRTAVPDCRGLPAAQLALGDRPLVDLIRTVRQAERP